MPATIPTPITLLDLPVEILEEICWQSGNRKLTLVSSIFRDVIYSSQRFWSSIRLSRGQFTLDAHKFLALRLERGGTAPLDISIVLLLVHQASGHIELWSKLGRHRCRMRKLSILTDNFAKASDILSETLDLEHPLPIPTLQTISIRYQQSGPDNPGLNMGRLPRTPLRFVLSLANRLTILTLPCVSYYVPYPSEPLWSLETLILDAPVSTTRRPPSLYQILLLLSRTPALKTLWCKTHSSDSMNPPINEQTFLQPRMSDFDQIRLPLPVDLPALEVMSVTINGESGQLLVFISAPLLHSLQLDGTFYLTTAPMVYVANLLPTLHKVARYAPGLRRLAFIGASPSYQNNAAWPTILGCTETPPPFPLLESIALREIVEGSPGHAYYENFNDELLELYMRKGRIKLRRLAITGCGPCFSHDALHRFIKAAAKRLDSGQIFELEVDGQAETYEPLEISDFGDLPVKLTLHELRVTVKNWWNMNHDPLRSEEYLF